MTRWTERARGRWEATCAGYSLEVFSTGCSGFAWHVFDPNAVGGIAIASGDEADLVKAKRCAEYAACGRQATPAAIASAMMGRVEVRR